MRILTERNKERAKEYGQTWRLKNREKMRAYYKAWAEAHPESKKKSKQKHYRAHREYYLRAAREAQQKRLLFLDSLKKSCQICGENDPRCLDFHHRDSSTRLFSPGAGVRSMDELLQEVEKCDVLCANCHRKLHSRRESYQ